MGRRVSAAIERFSFQGDALEVIRLPDGDVGLVLRQLCEVFDLDVDTQRTKLKEAPWATTVIMTVVAGDGKAREVTVLHRRSLPGWLFSIHSRKVRSAVRAKLVAYQREAADVLADNFLGRRGNDAHVLGAAERLARHLVEGQGSVTLGAKQARALVLKPLLQAARIMGDELRGVQAKLTELDNEVRLHTEYPRCRAQSWKNLPREKVGRAVSKVAEIVARATR